MGELTVLGSCGAWPEAGRACAGFLLTHYAFRVVLALGFGAASRLFQHCEGLPDAVVVTHEHPDHCADVTALGRAWHYTVQAAAPGKRLPLHCTPGTLHRLEAMEPRPHPVTIFDIHELAPSRDLAPFPPPTHPLPHPPPQSHIHPATPRPTL